MSDGTGLAEMLLGLDRFRVLETVSPTCESRTSEFANARAYSA